MSKKVYNILLITGIVTSEHDPKVNPMLRVMLESTGRFKVKISEEFTGATAETLQKYDAVLVDYDGKESIEAPYVGWGINAERVLYDYAAKGGGVIMYHSSIIKGNPALPEEFVKLIGYDFDFNNGGRKSPKLELTVKFTDNHEITRGLLPVWSTGSDDFFVNMKPASNSHVAVLATVKDAVEDYDFSRMQKHRIDEFNDVDFSKLPGINEDVPVAWINTYGKGRVFSVFIGHGPDTLRRHPFVAMMCRGAEWVCGGEVTLEPPNIDGNNRTRSWPYYWDTTVQQYAWITQF
ncbi:MAG: ThuA domain-containing protein [Treponema sp.]|jgi:hypothetical protein|nr:ThuA domain-containing protein [Treponema sp.]